MIARASDPASFRTLRTLLEAYENDLVPELRHGDVPNLDELTERYGDPNAAFLAYAGDAAIGCVGVRRSDASSALVERLYVEPAGRTHGAGRALVRAAIDFARERGCERLALDTHKELLPAAYRLYTALGFVEYESCAAAGYACPTFMELRLRPQ